jgi:hypothetical protein
LLTLYTMKYFFSIILSIGFYTAFAQKARINSIDSIYYFVDTIKTPAKERILEIGIESPYQYFTIKCPCLKYNAEPTFVYKLTDSGGKIDKSAFDKLNTVSLVKLINLAKQTADLTATTLYIYFFVEKKSNNEFVIHKARLVMPRKPEVIIDYQKVTFETTKTHR